MCVTIDDLDLLSQFLDAAPDAMVVVDQEGIIRLSNAQAAQLFQTDLAGLRVDQLVPKDVRMRHATHRADYESAPRARPMGEGMSLEALRGNGTRIPVAISLSPITAGGERFTVAAVRDMTQQREQEQQLRESLAQKEVLLKEVHHRVKNNLQIIISLLRLQTRSSPHLKEELDEAQARVRTMALVHERLYQASEAGAVDVAEYLRALVQDLRRGLGGVLAIDLDVQRHAIDPDTAITLGLIINELVSNAAKHAVAPDATMRLEVDTRGGVQVVAQDNGPGMPEDSEDAPKGIGVRLVEQLAEQLGCSAAWTTDAGTRVEIR